MWTGELNNCEIIPIGAEVDKLLKIFLDRVVEVDQDG